MEKRIKYTGIFIAILLLRLAISCSESSDSGETTSNAGGGGSGSNSNCPTKTCGDFSSRAAAQATYDSNKSCYKNLDSDSDGIACENLK